MLDIYDVATILLKEGYDVCDAWLYEGEEVSILKNSLDALQITVLDNTEDIRAAANNVVKDTKSFYSKNATECLQNKQVDRLLIVNDLLELVLDDDPLMYQLAPLALQYLF